MDRTEELILAYKADFENETGFKLECKPILELPSIDFKILLSKSLEIFGTRTNRNSPQIARYTAFGIGNSMCYSNKLMSLEAGISATLGARMLYKFQSLYKSNLDFEKKILQFVEHLYIDTSHRFPKESIQLIFNNNMKDGIRYKKDRK